MKVYILPDRYAGIQIDDRFGRWTVTGPVAHEDCYWQVPVKCECGKEKTIRACLLVAGKTKGCLCGNGGVVRHGHSRGGVPKSRTLVSYGNMMARCHSPNNKRYNDYGGRGIVVCARWRESFDNFLADMGPKPSREYQIDRKDNDKGYEPGNCRWATRKQNQRNMRNNRLLTAFGQTLSVSEWAERLGVGKSMIFCRIRRGWAAEEILSPPRFRRTKHPTNPGRKP